MLPGKTYRPEDFIDIARRRKWLIILPFVFVSAGTAIFAHFLPNRYRAETSMLIVPQRVSESYVRSTVTTKMEDRLRSIGQQILSRARLERVIHDFNLYPEERRLTTMEDVVERMRTNDIAVQPVRDDAFRIAFKSSDPKTAMKVTERLASMFIEENLRDREVLAEGTDQFLEAQLDDARRRLIEHEKKLEAYRRKFSGELPSQLTSNLQVIQNTQMQLQSLADSLNRDRDRRLLLERAITEAEAAVAAPAPVAAVAGQSLALEGRAIDQLEAARKTLTAMEVRLKAAHPDIIALKRVIRDLEARVAVEGSVPGTPVLSNEQQTRRTRLDGLRAEMQNVDREIAYRRSEEDRLRQVVAEYQRRAESAPARESDLVELMRDYDTLQKIYSNLLAKKEDSKIAANLERRQIGEQFKILDPARLPETPFSPQRARINFFGALGGLALGLALAALMEYRDGSFRTEADIVSCLGLPVLAVVPRVSSAAERRRLARRRTATMFATAAAVVCAIAAATWRFVLR